MNSIVRLIFNEKSYWKVKFVSPMNSVRVYCSQKTWSTIAAGKKKTENALQCKTWSWTCIQTQFGKNMFWSLHFGSNIILVFKLILCLPQSLKTENNFYFSSRRQLTNGKVLCGKQSVVLANMTLMWLLKYEK